MSTRGFEQSEWSPCRVTRGENPSMFLCLQTIQDQHWIWKCSLKQFLSATQVKFCVNLVTTCRMQNELAIKRHIGQSCSDSFWLLLLPQVHWGIALWLSHHTHTAPSSRGSLSATFTLSIRCRILPCRAREQASHHIRHRIVTTVSISMSMHRLFCCLSRRIFFFFLPSFCFICFLSFP